MANNKREKIREYYLIDTPVENMFINEFMPMAPGEYVKVYLYALMYVDLGQDMPNSEIAHQLGMQEEDVLKAWSYWEKLGVIRKITEGEGNMNYSVEFLNLKGNLYGRHTTDREAGDGERSPKDGTDILSDDEIRNLYMDIEKTVGRTLNGSEMSEIISWMSDYNASFELVKFAFEYCTNIGKNNLKYVAGVVKNWVSKGLSDRLSAEEYLQETSQRYFIYKRIFQALGFKRNPTEDEQRKMDTWIDDMGYSIDTILVACSRTSGISNPNINYVNKILQNWKEQGLAGAAEAAAKSTPAVQDKKQNKKQAGGKVISVSDVKKYYVHIQEEAKKAALARRKEVYAKIPRIEEIENCLNELNMQISKSILMSGNEKKEKLNQLKEASGKLMQERAILLTENNFEINYMDIKYQCDLCKDSGTNEAGERCICFPERAREASVWMRSFSDREN